MLETESRAPRLHAHEPGSGLDVCPECLCTFGATGKKQNRTPLAPSTPTRDNREGEILKSAGVGGLDGRNTAVASSLFSAAPPSVLFRPSARPRPSRAAGTFPLAWPGMNQPRCASRRRHVTAAGWRCGPDAPPLHSQADSRAAAPTAKDKRSPALLAAPDSSQCLA